MNFLRTTSPRRLIAGAALSAALVVGGVAVATAANGGGSPPPPKALEVAISDAVSAPRPAGITARIRFTNTLVADGALGMGTPLLTGASGRLWLGDGRTRLELQSQSGDAQVSLADGRLSIYDASSNTVYKADLGTSHAPVGVKEDAGTPSVDRISAALTELAKEAAISGAEPTTQAGRPAYEVSVTPKHDAGLLGRAQLAWDAANGVPLRIAVSAAGSDSPVLALEVTDISYGAVDSGALAVIAPPGAKVVDLGTLANHQGPGDAKGESVEGLNAVKAAVPFELKAPDTLVGLPRTGVRLLGGGDSPTALVTYGKGLGVIAVIERPAATGKDNPLGALPEVTINGATGHELPTALGTLIAVERAGVSYTLLATLPPNAAEAALRAVIG